MYLADGEVAFFGKREEAMNYFESIGLACPAYYNMAGLWIITNWLYLDFAIHTLAIDNELDEEARANRIEEVHLLCEQFK